MECVKTNINGAENVIDAALESGVSDVVAYQQIKQRLQLIYMVLLN